MIYRDFLGSVATDRKQKEKGRRSRRRSKRRRKRTGIMCNDLVAGKSWQPNREREAAPGNTSERKRKIRKA